MNAISAGQYFALAVEYARNPQKTVDPIGDKTTNNSRDIFTRFIDYAEVVMTVEKGHPRNTVWQRDSHAR